MRGPTGLGARGALDLIPGALESVFGSRAPVGVAVFLRIRPGAFEGAPAMDAEMHHGPAAETAPDGDGSGR